MGNIFEFIRDNIFHIGPILAAALIGLVIILERSQALMMTYPFAGSNRFFEKIRDLLMADRLPEALTLCEQYRNKPVARVCKEALLRAHQPEELISDGLELAVSQASQLVQARTPYLATIANVSTLLGLFGTIAGLIESFKAIGSASAQQKSVLLAQGISSAMNATMMGLAVAIPCMIMFSILIGRANHLVAEIEQAATRMRNLINERYYDSDKNQNLKRYQ